MLFTTMQFRPKTIQAFFNDKTKEAQGLHVTETSKLLRLWRWQTVPSLFFDSKFFIHKQKVEIITGIFSVASSAKICHCMWKGNK